MHNKDDMEDILSEEVIKITFTKADGSERVLIGTRDYFRIPEAFRPSSDKTPVTVNEDVVRVFDLEANGWRSFRVDSVTDFTAIDARLGSG